VQEAVARLLAYDEWFNGQVQVGMDQIKRGEFIEEEKWTPVLNGCFTLRRIRWAPAAADDLEGIHR